MSTRLPRLQSSVPISDEYGHPSYSFHIYWDKFASSIEGNLTDIITALATMPDIADVHVSADYTGTANAGVFPVVVTAARFSGSTDNTAVATWSFTVDSGMLSATIAAGVLTITAITATSRVTITSLYNGVSKSRSFTVYLDVAPPPVTGTSSGGSAYATSFTNITSATHAPVSADIAVVVGSTGTVTLTAPLTVSTNGALPTGNQRVWGKWQWWNGAAWVDLAAEVTSNPHCKVNAYQGGFAVANGTLSVPDSKTGLTVASSQKFRLEARNDVGTRTMTLSGTASAVSN